MKVEFTSLKRQYEKYQIEYEAAALRVLRSGWYILGDELKEFETVYAAFHGVKYCIGINSGLDALVLALRALDIGKGDEVIVQANTFIATPMAISECGAIPVFADTDEFFGLATHKLEALITPNTKAIMPVHLYGQTCDMNAIMSIAQKHNLYVIEDCAQAHGAKYKNQLVGTFADVGCFSFYPTKPIGAFGDAGALITNSDEIAEKLYMLRNYGSKIKYRHEIVGVNTRLDEVQASLLKVNLKYLWDGNAERYAIAERYMNEINNPLVTLPVFRPDSTHTHHIFPLLSTKRNELKLYLENNKIQTQIHYPIPCHLAECYKTLGYGVGSLPVSEKFSQEELSLPIYVGMPMHEVSYVIEKINHFKWR